MAPSCSRLNPAATSFKPTMALASSHYYPPMLPAVFLMPPPPAFPPWTGWVQVKNPLPPPQPATHCTITEIGEGSSEVASPRSVIPSSTKTLHSASPPQRPAIPPQLRLAFDPKANITSLMIRNIPNKFMKNTLMAILDLHCAKENAKLSADGVESEYDFLYVPVDFGTKFNKGYAFINMTTADAARRLHEDLHRRGWEAGRSRKVCDIVHARIQGLDALLAHFSGSRFPCADEELLPVRFEPPRNGVRATAEHVVGSILLDHRTN